MKKLLEVLSICEGTASWYGLKINGLNQKNNLGDTVLHTVCTWGEVGSVSVLIDAGANVNAIGDLGATPLFNAVIGGNELVVKMLLKAGADPRAVNEFGSTALDYAISTGSHKNIISLLKTAKGRKV